MLIQTENISNFSNSKLRKLLFHVYLFELCILCHYCYLDPRSELEQLQEDLIAGAPSSQHSEPQVSLVIEG